MVAVPISRGKSEQNPHPNCSTITPMAYKCRECSTNRPIIMQNKANLRKSQMDVKLNMSSDYEEKIELDIW